MDEAKAFHKDVFLSAINNKTLSVDTDGFVMNKLKELYLQGLVLPISKVTWYAAVKEDILREKKLEDAIWYHKQTWMNDGKENEISKSRMLEIEQDVSLQMRELETQTPEYILNEGYMVSCFSRTLTLYNMPFVEFRDIIRNDGVERWGKGIFLDVAYNYSGVDKQYGNNK